MLAIGHALVEVLPFLCISGEAGEICKQEEIALVTGVEGYDSIRPASKAMTQYSIFVVSPRHGSNLGHGVHSRHGY